MEKLERHRFVQFFCALQASLIVLNAPLGLARSVPGFLLHMSPVNIITDWVVLAGFAASFNLFGAAILASLWWSGRLTGVREKLADQVGYAVCIFVYVLSSLLLLFAQLPPGFLGSAVKFVLCGLLAGAVSYCAVRYADFSALRQRLMTIGAVVSIAMAVLMILPLAVGVRIVPFPKVERTLGERPAAPRGAPNVIIVVADALSASAMSLYGNALPTTPKIGDLARDGMVVDGLTAASTFTVPTTATILSGLYPNRHGVTSLDSFFVDQPANRKDRFLPEILRKHGYVTIAVSGNPNGYPSKFRIADQFDLLAMPGQVRNWQATIFWHFSNANIASTYPIFPILEQAVDFIRRIKKQSDLVADASPDLEYSQALQWIDQQRGGGRPFFMWIHTIPPHAPYLPPAPHIHLFDPGPRFLTLRAFTAIGPWFYDPGIGRLPDSDIRVLKARYLENVHYADDRFAAFFEELRARGLLGNTVVVFTGDHGETFGRWIGHGGPYLDDDLIRVPLVVWGPSVRAGLRVRQRVSQVDLAPTILDLAGVPIPSQMDGQSIGPLLRGQALAPRPLYAMQLEQNARFGPLQKGTLSVIDGDWKYVLYLQSQRSELFSAIPGIAESTSVEPQQRAVAAKMDGDLRSHFGNVTR